MKHITTNFVVKQGDLCVINNALWSSTLNKGDVYLIVSTYERSGTVLVFARGMFRVEFKYWTRGDYLVSDEQT